MVKIRRAIITNGGKVYSYIPKDILREIGYDKKKNYIADFWNNGKTICMRLIEKKPI